MTANMRDGSSSPPLRRFLSGRQRFLEIALEHQAVPTPLPSFRFGLVFIVGMMAVLVPSDMNRSAGGNGASASTTASASAWVVPRIQGSPTSLSSKNQHCYSGGPKERGKSKGTWRLHVTKEEEEESFPEKKKRSFPGRLVDATLFSSVNRTERQDDDIVWPIQYRVGGGIGKDGAWFSADDTKRLPHHARYELPSGYANEVDLTADTVPSIVDKYGRLWRSVSTLAGQDLLRIGLPFRQGQLRRTVVLPKSGKSVTIPLPWDCAMMVGVAQEPDRGRYVYASEMVRRYRKRQQYQEELEESDSSSSSWDGVLQYEYDPNDDYGKDLYQEEAALEEEEEAEGNEIQVAAETHNRNIVTYTSLPFYGGTADATGTTVVVANYASLDTLSRQSLYGRAIMGWVGNLPGDHDDDFGVPQEEDDDEDTLGLSQVDTFAVDDERWLAHYDKLVEFHAMFGHTRVWKCWPTDLSLASWVFRQRDQYSFLTRNAHFRHAILGDSKFGKSRVSLTSWRIQLLFDLGFIFRTKLTWRQRFHQLVSYRERHGHLNVDQFDEQESFGYEGLYLWLRDQRTLRRKWLHQQEQEQEEEQEEEREQQVEQQRQSVQESDDHDESSLKLQWDTEEEDVTNIDEDEDDLSLSERFQMLDELGVDWSPLDSQWERRIEQLRQYVSQHGHADVTKRQDDGLAGWLTDVRRQYRLYQNPHERWQSTMTEERIQMLEDLHVTWEPLERSWQDRYQELVQYHETHGHCRVTLTDEKHAHLVPWSLSQRALFRRGSLDPSRVEQLQALGFVFDLAEFTFARGIEKLRAFREEFGHVNVPLSYEDRALAFFVKQQRRLRMEQLGVECGDVEDREDEVDGDGLEEMLTIATLDDGDRTATVTGGTVDTATTKEKLNPLTTDRIRQLDELGFVWDARENSWMQNYEKLLAFRATHGHVDVPTDHVDSQLYNFVAWHRRYHAKGSAALTPKRRQMLEDLGFTWNTNNALWMERFQQLQDYRQRFGDCNVPRQWDENPALGKWVNRQRVEYTYWKEGRKRSTLTEERRTLLEGIDFSWRVMRSSRRRSLSTTKKVTSSVKEGK